ncbi:MAG: alpha-glucan family phosphorylase [Bacteroidales bacterium]|nr:alpha-glucan family phosphorylase [Bacteroidales bacterium]
MENFLPEHIFEISWEVCNKIGGIHTVISTKATTLLNKFNDNLIFIGPDVWKDSKLNHEFIEDKNLFRSWKLIAEEEGLRIKIGRWNIEGNPLAILIDFTTFIPEKDKIFSKFWEKYNLDSISGQWDYVEPALFGYAAGKVIESFTNYNLSDSNKIIAHFHEWMTGTGILYLKDKAPYIGTLFTTHATATGRAISCNEQDLYNNLDNYNGDQKANEFNITSKHSLEKNAANNADCFTTVSKITAKECKQFLEKEPDIITPNGFENNFVPKNEHFISKRNSAKNKLKEVSEAVLGYNIPDNTLFMCISGRYEFKNKGIDLFIDSLYEVNKNTVKDIVAFILIPADNYGARKDIIENINNKTNKKHIDNPFITHYLSDADYDRTLNRIKHKELTNKQSEKVKIIFVPCYLNGKDGIFNMPYYDILIGMDLTLFPSYYEPWGYTPLESIAFKVPTITTTFAGFSQWIISEQINNNGVIILNRTDNSNDEIIKEISDNIVKFSELSESEINNLRENVSLISEKALWGNFINYYYDAYKIALKKVNERPEKIKTHKQTESKISIKSPKNNKPLWRKLFIQSDLPKNLKGLYELSENIWWSWNYEAMILFKYIDKLLWEKINKNPILLLKEISAERLAELENDNYFIEQYNLVYKKFKDYLFEKPDPENPLIAYFSMEYGLNDNIKIFSGGLGILAGDYLKEASDSNVRMVAIGFLYKYGYFTQRIAINGDQIESLEAQKFSQLPIKPVRDESGTLKTIEINLPGRLLTARIWKVEVGRIPLYLLDTDLDINSEQDKQITHQLYGGDWENRLKQEIVLGIGGVRVLETLNIKPDLYHCNEGHAALLNIERLAALTTKENYTFDEAIEIIRPSSLFTTHTPVPAGHDKFDEDLIRTYLRHIPERLKISWEKFLTLWKVNPDDIHEKLSMSILAARLSQEINGVSKLHGKVTREIFNELWEGYYPEELHIGHVTNGVHYPTWTAKEWRILYENEFGEEFLKNQSDKNIWKQIYNVPDKEIWNIRYKLRKKLIDYIKIRFKKNWIRRYEDPKYLVEILNNIDENTLTIGFARRFASYKRALLIFNDIERLTKIVNNKDMPVQFIFAGKAHPNDKAGQDLIKYIVEISRKPEFIGKILFLENYDIELAKRLVKGVDIWMNTPTRPLEASGTSGQKAVMNGVLNFSVLDGWWVEGYKENAGWALTEKRTYDNQDFQNELDAQTIYSMLENEIIPLFYKRDNNNIPVEWIAYIKKCIAEIAPEFTTKRMLDDYIEKYYNKLYERSKNIKNNNHELAIKLANWKKKIYRTWDNIEVVSVDFPSTSKRAFNMGDVYKGEVVIDLKELSNEDIGVEMIIANSTNDKKTQIIKIEELKLSKTVDTLAFYNINLQLLQSGIFDYGIRIFPNNKNLPHRQDFSCVKWI